MNKKSIFTRNTILWVSITFVYSLVTLTGVLYHEPWRDEAQVWLIVRDLSIPDIFSHLSAYGNLGVWYVILFPFAKLGFPYFTMQIIHWLISITTCTLFLFKAPINKFIKVFFVFSYYMVFEYGVVARDYMLTVLFLFLIATFYKSRFTKPVRFAVFIFLLFNCHVLGFGAAFALLIIYFAEVKSRKRMDSFKTALIIMTAGFAVAILTLIPFSTAIVDATIPVTYIPILNYNAVWTILTSIQNAFIPTVYNFEEIKMPLFFLLVLIVYILSAFRTPTVFVFLIISLCWLFYVFITKQYYARYDGLIVVFVIFTLWIKEYYTETNNRLSKKLKFINYSKIEASFKTIFILSLMVNSIFGMSSIRKEYLYNHSGAKEMAEYIIHHHLQNNEIACFNCWSASVSPYLPTTKLWSINSKRYETFFILDSVYIKSSGISSEEMLKRVKEKYNKEAILLTGEPQHIVNGSGVEVKLIAKNEKYNWKDNGENYFLYKIIYLPH